MRSLRDCDGKHVEAVIRAAERRRLLVLAFERAAIAVALVLAGGILMLLLGTQILNWYWLALLAAAGAGIVATGVRSRPLERYRLAQILDHRLHLSDSLSTACFLLTQSRGNDPFARFQLARAEEIARSVRPARAFPFSAHRRWALSAALAAVAFGLFAVRYLVTSSLSLHQSLVPIHLGGMLEALEEPFSPGQSNPSGHFSPGPRADFARTAHSQQGNEKNRPSLAEEAKSGNPAGAAPGAATAQNSGSNTDSTELGDGKSPNGQISSSEPQPQPNANDAAARESAKGQDQGTAAQQGSSGVLDKMKDALSSLMAKMRAPSASERAAREGERSEPQQRSGDQTALGRDQHSDQRNARSDQASQQQNTEGQAQGQASEKAQAARGRNADSADRKGTDSQSGAGRQDGDKAIKEAEQQQAMGKLAEIIGKRSASLTGDMTVETASGNQQLKTEYSQRMGHHSDLGGEINRNEIPLMYQQYIRDYMEAVRKQQRAQ
ncbi:MAG TPA: hypothetical protein VHU83_19985 [Bryobacteraceae bacterium]|nr:hypothetical protein [Bryobacteraceae bacterium]